MQQTPKISIICPFYNEENIIEAATQRMISNLRNQFGEEWELLLVNDGSTDQSLNLLMSTLEKLQEKKVKVISYELNQGRGRALKTGIDLALGDMIVTTEVDCSWGHDIVLRLYDALKSHSHANFVVASPHLLGGSLVNVPAHRKFMTKFGNRLISIFFTSGMTMNTGMTRAYWRNVIQPLVVYENGKEFHLEVLLKLLILGFKAIEIPAIITWADNKIARDVMKKRKSSTNLMTTIFSHLKFVAMAQPTRSFALLSLLCFLIGAACLVGAVWRLFIHKVSVYLAVLGLIMFLFCLLFGGFSVLFLKFQDFLRIKLTQYYPTPHPPSIIKGEIIFPHKNMME